MQRVYVQRATCFPNIVARFTLLIVMRVARRNQRKQHAAIITVSVSASLLLLFPVFACIGDDRQLLRPDGWVDMLIERACDATNGHNRIDVAWRVFWWINLT